MPLVLRRWWYPASLVRTRRFEVFEAARPVNGHADDLGHVAVIAEEVLRARGSDVTAGDGGGEGSDPGPLLDGSDQVGSGGVREGVGHLVEDVFTLYQSDNRGRLGGPEAFGSRYSTSSSAA